MPGSRLLQQQELLGRLEQTRWLNRPRSLGHAGGFPGRALHPMRKPSDEVRRSLDRRPVVD
jgi:hypothetical protein